MSEFPKTPPEDPNFEGLTFELNDTEQTQFKLLNAQDEYLERLTKFVNFPHDSVLRRLLVGQSNDMYALLHNRLDQIAHMADDYAIDPVPRAGKLIKQLDTRQIQYFDTYHPASESARPLSTDQIAKRRRIISSQHNLELPQAMMRIHAQRTHQHLGHYILGGYPLEWKRQPKSLGPPTL